MIGIYISLYGLGLLIIRYSNHHHVTIIITKLTLSYISIFFIRFYRLQAIGVFL
jgi:hypothetical protein